MTAQRTRRRLMLSDDGVIDPIAVEIATRGARPAALTPAERQLAAARILAWSGTPYLISKRLHVSGTTALTLAARCQALGVMPRVLMLADDGNGVIATGPVPQGQTAGAIRAGGRGCRLDAARPSTGDALPGFPACQARGRARQASTYRQGERMPTVTNLQTLTNGLRAWIRGHDDHVRAAVELLIDHDCWLRRADFTRACVQHDVRQAWIDWAAARRFVDEGVVASSSEMAVLDLAVALGENRYRLSIMGAANSHLIATAVARAVRVQP